MTHRVVRVSVPAEDVDLAAEALWSSGAAGIEERPARGGAVVLVAGPPAGGDATGLLDAVASRWPAELVAVDLDAALDAWRPHARPVEVGSVRVRQPWVDPPPAAARHAAVAGDAGGPVDLLIDPGRAFGSGAHASTRLALAALVDRAPLAGRALDVGCGSGVLAIAAVLLGARSAVGLDHDPAAVEAARANAARNGVADRVTVVGGDAAGVATAGLDAPVADGAFDIVVANMLLPELVAAAPLVAASVAPGGVVVLSGVLAGQARRAEAAYAAAGLVADPAGGPPDDAGWAVLVLRTR